VQPSWQHAERNIQRALQYNIEEEQGSGVFLDIDGSMFGHVLDYLRDGVVYWLRIQFEHTG
jgi:hypothetical protein